MHPTNEEGVDDMAMLAELHGGSIMHNLHQRYKRNQIYVSATLMPFQIPSFEFFFGGGVFKWLFLKSISCLLRLSG